MKNLRRYIELPLMILGGACVLTIMLLTAADVFARYALAAPIRGAYEFVQALLAIAILSGLPLVGLRGEHISVRLVEAHRLGRFSRWVELAFALVMAAVLFLLAHRVWLLADLVGANGQTLGAFAIPLEPLYRAISVLTGISALLMATVVAHMRFTNTVPHRDRP